MRKIITLLTDFGLESGFVGTMKGVIYSINQQARIVDLSHEIKAHNILEGAFVLKTSYHFFPKGTIHLVVVDPGVGSERRAILVQTKDYYFIGPDNGVLSFALENQKIQKIIELTNKKYFSEDLSQTFHGRDIFAPVAAYLSKGVKINRFGNPIKEYKEFTLLTPAIHKGKVIGKVIYVDHFGNLVTNISGGLVLKLARKRIQIKIKNLVIDKLSKSYAERKPLEPMAIIGSSDYLEIAVNQDNAQKILNVDEGSEIELCVRE